MVNMYRLILRNVGTVFLKIPSLWCCIKILQQAKHQIKNSVQCSSASNTVFAVSSSKQQYKIPYARRSTHPPEVHLSVWDSICKTVLGEHAGPPPWRGVGSKVTFGVEEQASTGE